MKKTIVVVVFALLQTIAPVFAQEQTSEELTPSAYYTAYLVNAKTGVIGMAYETCYTNGSAMILVTLNPGIYLKPEESLVLTPQGKHKLVVSYTATVEGPVGNFEGYSSIGCVTPSTVLDLDTVSAPPHQTWTEDGYTLWY